MRNIIETTFPIAIDRRIKHTDRGPLQFRVQRIAVSCGVLTHLRGEVRPYANGKPQPGGRRRAGVPSPDPEGRARRDPFAVANDPVQRTLAETLHDENGSGNTQGRWSQSPPDKVLSGLILLIHPVSRPIQGKCPPSLRSGQLAGERRPPGSP